MRAAMRGAAPRRAGDAGDADIAVRNLPRCRINMRFSTLLGSETLTNDCRAVTFYGSGDEPMNMRNALVWMTMAMSVVACGDDEEDAKDNSQPATVNKQAATATAQSTIAALSATTTGGDVGISSATSLSSVAQSSQSLLTPQAPGASTKSFASALKIEEVIGTLDESSPGCNCTATSCTFSNCKPSSGSSQFTIDGSYSWGGGHVECKSLKYVFGTDGAGPSVGFSTKVEVTLNCDLTISATTIKGYLQSAGSSSTEVAGQSTAGAYSSSWDIKTTYNDVTFSNGQPTGGSMKVEGTTTTSAAGQQQAFSGSAEISFPAN